MAAAEAVVASRSRDQETTTARNGGHSAVEQLALPLDGPSPADMARGVIPLAPRREKPDPVTAPTRQDNPSHDTDAPASGALWDPFPGKFTKIPLAIASHYASELGPTKTQILEAMHNLIYGYRAKPVGRRRRGPISYKEIAEASGVCVRTVERHVL